MRNVALAVLVGLTGSCARCGGANQGATDAPVAASIAPPPGARCALVAHHLVGGLGGDADAESPVAYGAELGGVAHDAQAFHVGYRSAGSGGEPGVMRVPFDGATPTRVSGAVWAKRQGARAPRVAIDGKGSLLVGALHREGDELSLELFEGAASRGILRQGVDDSEVTAIVATAKGTLVAWDDVVDEKGKPARGRVHVTAWNRVRGVPPDAGSDASTDLVAGAPTTDAHSPLLVASPDGTRAALLYLAERPEDVDDHDGGAGEPSQDHAQRWIEVVLVDTATGTLLGAPRALTKETGHAQTMAATWSESGLYVVVRDDARPSDGDGGTLVAVRVVVGAALEEPTRRVVADKDVAPGLASIVPIPGGVLVSFLGLDGRARLVPSFVETATTLEPVLDHRRIVGARGPIVLATKLVGSALDLGVVRCSW